MVKNQVARGTITIVIPFRETFSTNADDDAMHDYIENNVMDYIEDIDETDIRILDVDIEYLDVEDYYEDNYGNE